MLTPASDVFFDIPDRVCACSYKIYLFRGGWKIMSWTWSEVFQSHLWLNRHAHSTRIIRVERKFILEIVQIPLINSWPTLPSRDKYPGKQTGGGGGQWCKWRPYQSCTRYGDQLSKSAKCWTPCQLLPSIWHMTGQCRQWRLWWENKTLPRSKNGEIKNECEYVCK